MDDYISRKELAARLRTSTTTVKRWVRAGLLGDALLRATKHSHPRYFYPVVIQLLKQRGSSFLGASPQRKQNKPNPPPQAKQNKPGKPPRKRTKHKKRKKK
jgi:hypothetical protein